VPTSPSAPGAWRRAKTRRSGSKSGSGRWSQWDEIGWVHYPEIGWSHSDEIRRVQSHEILHDNAIQSLHRLIPTVESWLKAKGVVSLQAGMAEFTLRDGRSAKIDAKEYSTASALEWPLGVMFPEDELPAALRRTHTDSLVAGDAQRPAPHAS
jgi:hypothetical protein